MPFANRAIGGDLLARLDQNDVALGEIPDIDIDVFPIDELMRLLGQKLGDFDKSIAGGACRARFQVVTEKKDPDKRRNLQVELDQFNLKQTFSRPSSLAARA